MLEVITFAPNNDVEWTGNHVTAFFDSIEKLLPFKFTPILIDNGRIHNMTGIHFDITIMDKGQSQENRGNPKVKIPLNMILMHDGSFLWFEAQNYPMIDALEFCSNRRTLSDFRRKTIQNYFEMVEAIVLPDGFDPLKESAIGGIHMKKIFREKRRLIVMGCGGTLGEDFSRVKGLKTERMAINRIGTFFKGHIDHWATLHPELFFAWKEARAVVGGNDDYVSWCHCLWPGCCNTDDWGGSSGLFAAKVGVELGYEEVILCGIPLDMRLGHLTDDDWQRKDSLLDQYKPAWNRVKTEICSTVRSLSGWTKELLEKERRSVVFLTKL